MCILSMRRWLWPRGSRDMASSLPPWSAKCLRTWWRRERRGGRLTCFGWPASMARNCTSQGILQGVLELGRRLEGHLRLFAEGSVDQLCEPVRQPGVALQDGHRVVLQHGQPAVLIIGEWTRHVAGEQLVERGNQRPDIH